MNNSHSGAVAALVLAAAAVLPSPSAIAQTLCRGQNPIYTYPDGKKLYAQYYKETGQNANQPCFILSCAAVCPFPTSVKQNERLRLLKQKAAPRDGTQASPSEPYVNYDTVFIDQHDPDKIFGNWRADADSACKDKKVNQYQSRNQMTGYVFQSKCVGSRDGVWKFNFQGH